MLAAEVEDGFHLLVGEIGVMDKGAEVGRIDRKAVDAAACLGADGKPAGNVGRDTGDFADLLQADEAAKAAAVGHDAVCVVTADAGNLLEQRGVGRVDVEGRAFGEFGLSVCHEAVVASPMLCLLLFALGACGLSAHLLGRDADADVGRETAVVGCAEAIEA